MLIYKRKCKLILKLNKANGKWKPLNDSLPPQFTELGVAVLSSYYSSNYRRSNGKPSRILKPGEVALMPVGEAWPVTIGEETISYNEQGMVGVGKYNVRKLEGDNYLVNERTYRLHDNLLAPFSN